ncbi:MAG: hypothetical protein H6742_16100 [Alphaproteobacteria bacterium]|nr:hypothetical protein [Alphaproteobacteria bacterium]
MSPRAQLRPVLLLLVLAASAAGATPRSVALPSDPTPADLHALQDRAWWSPRVPSGAAPFSGTTGNRAADCGMCHQEIYREWQASTHAHAWTDAQFQGELHKDPQVGWICINCHTPAADQQQERVTWDPDDGVRQVQRADNAAFDPAWQAEGISCLTCHWRPDGIAAVHADNVAPHPTVIDPSLQQADLCLSCHQAAVRLEDALVCHFTTGQEWEQVRAAGTVPDQPCQDCHMPTVERAVAPGAPVRQTRRHAWPGALIPKDDHQARAMAELGLAPMGEAEGTAFAWEGGLDLALQLPDEAMPGEVVQARIAVGNARAGHAVPTGDPERQLFVEVSVVDGQDHAIAGGRARYGQRWIWWPVARKLDDERLFPGESKELVVPFVMPADGARVEVRLEHERISAENAAHHGLTDYPQRREVARRSGAVVAGSPLPEQP